MKGILGFGLVMLGSGIVGYIFSWTNLILGLLGLMGFGMALAGMVLLAEAGKKRAD